MMLFSDVILTRDWMGHPPGSKIRIVQGLALQLIQRGGAVIAGEKMEGVIETKAIEAAPVDKMMRKPQTKK